MNNQDRLIIEKEQLNDLVNSCQEEIRRLNNVLNELEKELFISYKELFKDELVNGRVVIQNILNYLKELKESDK